MSSVDNIRIFEGEFHVNVFQNLDSLYGLLGNILAKPNLTKLYHESIDLEFGNEIRRAYIEELKKTPKGIRIMSQLK